MKGGWGNYLYEAPNYLAKGPKCADVSFKTSSKFNVDALIVAQSATTR